VSGLGLLGIAVVRRLAAAGEKVTVLASSEDAGRYAHELARLGVPVCMGISSSPGELEAAGLREASAVILTSDDDAGNVDAALNVRRLRPALPIVARVFDPSLARYLEETEEKLRVRSVSLLAGPRFAEIALRAAKDSVSEPPPGGARSQLPRRRAASPRVDPILVRLTVVTAIVTVASVLFFAQALNLPLIDAFYLVVETITNTGFGDFPIRAAGGQVMLATIVLMIGGAGLLGLAYALVTGWFVARRLEVLHGRRPERGSGHAVVAGAGNVGFRVAQRLASAGMVVVVIERQSESPNVSALRAEGLHVIIADAGLDESLDLAGVDRASVVLAVTDSDAVNLRVALAVRERGLGVPIAIRLISPELSEHLHGRKGIVTLSPIAVASEAFVAAALEMR
jgi:Trk K+ transport system NAD-binding subunit